MQRSSRLVHPVEEDLNALTQPPTAWKIQKQRKPGGDKYAADQAGSSMHIMSNTERDPATTSELGVQSH